MTFPSDTTTDRSLGSTAEEPINFPRGLLGFEDYHQFAMQRDPVWAPLCRLQSLEDRTVSFVLAPPRLFQPRYTFTLDPLEISELGECHTEDIEVWAIVTMPDDPSQTSMNLQGPILINRRNHQAKQIVLGRSEYPTQFRIFTPEPDEEAVWDECLANGAL
jgi:flagellar assembly factor FliW